MEFTPTQSGGPMATLREASKIHYNAFTPATHQDIQTGSIQRIADAAEAMAKSHSQLIYDRDAYKRWYEDEKKKCKHLLAVIRGLKGRVTILNRKFTAP